VIRIRYCRCVFQASTTPFGQCWPNQRALLCEHVVRVAASGCIAFTMGCALTHDIAIQIVVAVWALVPPLWFLAEYAWWPPEEGILDERMRHLQELGRNLWLALIQVPMPALATAHSLSRNDGDVWVDKAVTQTDSFPLTDADTSARYCDTLQHGVSDPPAFTGLQRHAIQLSNTPNHPVGSVLADIPSESGTHPLTVYFHSIVLSSTAWACGSFYSGTRAPRRCATRWRGATYM
jgi:hypothetical protein